MSFLTAQRSELRTDCRYFSGYKPCHKNDGCPGCTHYAPRGPQILIIKLGAMGDVLRCKAILPALRREHPNAWVVWLTEKGSEALARDPLVDEVRTYDLAGLAALEGRHYLRLICLDKDAHAVSLAGRLTADRKQGFAPTAYNTITAWNEAAMYALRLGLSDELKFKHNRKTMPQIVAEIAELDYRGEEFGLVLPEAARAAAGKRWAEVFSGVEPGPVIGLNTGCGPVFATKGWTVENMTAYLRRAAAEGRKVVLLGGVRERETHRALMAGVGDAAGRFVFDGGNDNSLECFFGLVEKVAVLLSADSLAMHVAIALKRPVVAWFGPTCEQEVDLFGRGEKIVTDFACSPCYLKVCPKPVTCMEAMSADAVWAATERVLRRRS